MKNINFYNFRLAISIFLISTAVYLMMIDGFSLILSAVILIELFSIYVNEKTGILK